MTAKTEIAVAKAAVQCVSVCAGSWTANGARIQCERIIGELVEQVEAELTQPAKGKETNGQ